jgi:hypothetical protein
MKERRKLNDIWIVIDDQRINLNNVNGDNHLKAAAVGLFNIINYS